MSLNGEVIKKPGSDRRVRIQEFDQLLPWKTVRQNVVFALTSSPSWHRQGRDDKASSTSRRSSSPSSPTAIPTRFGRHEQRVAIARGMAMEPDIPADGRAVRRARRADTAQDAGRAVQLWTPAHFTVLFVTQL